ncbi:ABC transporter permease subunit [Breznakia pachnodae]|uniref:ABC-type transport system involved in multi-copper enzyme maturation permease subunit n=1 Tax=Breznakia pachnodae TaxID=265178 RepID=A0ABU0E5G5_9FIRM|nr:ABC transporter permease subunit [Breznakia pachnodae]MDQ0362131.1 ABC-type transport system involved in multi-copper enzyme maturation permease subunit [Breznakia pachnodae]
MVNSTQKAIIKKDVKTIMFNKRLFPVLLIVPFMFSVVMPIIFVCMAIFTPESSDDFRQLLSLVTALGPNDDMRQALLDIIINSMLPVFFIIIPIMASSVMAASSFVGEKEKRTLETLLYSPITLKQIFQSKIFASLALSMIVTFASFIVMVIVLQLTLMVLNGSNLSINIASWASILILLAPSMSLLAITLIVNGSAKSQTVEESQQRSVFLIIPIILLLIGQFTGILLVNALLLIVLSAIFLIIALLLMKKAEKKFNYETLLN